MTDTICTSVFNDYVSGSIESIKDTLNVIALNTAPVEVMNRDIDEVNFWVSIIALVVGVLGTWFGWLAYWFSKKTADNVVRMSADTQLAQFNDLIRHLYRNLIVTIAFARRQFESDVHCCYPSEVHLQKMKMLPEDVVHLEKYNDDTDIYKVMHELKLLMRNYDTEIDIAQMHLKERNLGNNVIKEDLDGLCFKPFYLIKSIIEVECAMDRRKKMERVKTKTSHYKDMMMIVLSEHFNKLAENMNNIGKWSANYMYCNYCCADVSDCGRSFCLLSDVGRHISECDYTGVEGSFRKVDFLAEKNLYLREKARFMFSDSNDEMLKPLWKLTEAEGLKEMIEGDNWDFGKMLSILISIDVAIEYDKIKMIYF